MAIGTHRQYFRRYRLSAAQYGEILVAEAFGGQKLGDSQPCYDVLTTEEKLAAVLEAAGGSYGVPADRGAEVLIQVRSKLSESRSGKASVVHCKTSDLEGSRRHSGMTHLVVVLLHPGWCRVTRRRSYGARRARCSTSPSANYRAPPPQRVSSTSRDCWPGSPTRH
jgi:hypothetical protein